MSVTNSELLREVEARRALPPPAMRRAIRSAAGVSQQRLGSEIGVTAMTVHRWERGACTPRGATLVAYAELLEQLRGAS